SPATGDIWAQMWDACYTPKYDHAGCPAVPSAGFQIFRSSDLKNIKTLTWQDRGGQAVHFPGDGRRAIVPGPTLRIFNSQTYEVVEELITPTQAAASSMDGRRAVILSVGHVLISEVAELGCVSPPVVAAQEFTFDGTLNDSVEVAHFRASGKLDFVPGRVGQALRLQGGEARMSSPSSFRLGDRLTENVSLAFWFRGRRTGHLVQRDSPVYWRLDWVDGQLYAYVGQQLKMGADAPANVWHHVALVRDHQTYRLYLDGRPVGAGESDTQRGGEFDGDFITSGDHDLDEFLTFGSTLSPQAVSKLAAAGPGGYCP
ncbi:MAG: hypothetical protein NTV70_06880, partial [Acidobacteria bacterium]|nr:hypothetical protein [Acidobacteriota bacterium]